jgi:hypothetical protein
MPLNIKTLAHKAMKIRDVILNILAQNENTGRYFATLVLQFGIKSNKELFQR